MKAYPTLDSQNAKILSTLGNLCSATVLLPISAVLSTGLEKRGNIAVASGGLTDIWKGVLGDSRVAIKAFRIYPAQNLKEAKEVSITSDSRSTAHVRNVQILWKRVPIWRRLSHPSVLTFRDRKSTRLNSSHRR